MFYQQLRFRAFTSCLLIGVLGGLIPASAAAESPELAADAVQVAVRPKAVQQPGVLATRASVAIARQSSGLRGVAGIAALPQAAQTGTTSSAPSQPKHRLAPWVWIAIAAGAGVGIGAAVLVGNRQSNHTATITPGTTINVGSGGITVGPPH